MLRVRRTKGQTGRAALADLATAVIFGLTLAGCSRWEPAAKQLSPAGGPVDVLDDPRAFAGYTLLAPLAATETFLINMRGQVVRSWKSDCTPALGAYLLANGHLLRPGAPAGKPASFGGTGAGGRLQQFTWDGELVWDFACGNDRQCPHHDVCPLPNGNVLVIAWEKKTAREAIAAGRRPKTVRRRSFLPDCLLEVKPTGKTTGRVVWEWHVWDHLVQDHDKTKANYGDVAAHPERIDVNEGKETLASLLASKDGLDKLRSIGYLAGASGGQSPPIDPDWTHVNSVAYHPKWDQILLSVRGFSEIWIIDHSTTRAEAAGRSGGRYGKGGDLLYRWGNPRTYHAGSAKDQQFFCQHNAHWIPSGYPGEDHVLVFNNGIGRPGGDRSTVDEIILPVDAGGRYTSKSEAAFGPDGPAWTCQVNSTGAFTMLLSGAQRLPNGNTLVCSGMTGTLVEVTVAGEVVWRYTNPMRIDPGVPPASGLGLPNSLFFARRYAPNYPGLTGRVK